MLYENNMKALYTKLSATGLFHVVAEDNCHILKSPTACAGLNLVFGSLTDYSLATARHLFQASPFSCIVDQTNEHTIKLLTHSGYHHQNTMPEMVLNITTYTKTVLVQEITLVPVDSIPLLHHWCAIVATTFELPITLIKSYSEPLFELKRSKPNTGIEMLLGFFKNRAATTVLIHRNTQIACVSSMTVLPEFQRRGLGTAMLQTCLNQEVDHGTELATLVSTSTGQPLYKKLGFQVTRSLKIFTRDV